MPTIGRGRANTLQRQRSEPAVGASSRASASGITTSPIGTLYHTRSHSLSGSSDLNSITPSLPRIAKRLSFQTPRPLRSTGAGDSISKSPKTSFEERIPRDNQKYVHSTLIKNDHKMMVTASGRQDICDEVVQLLQKKLSFNYVDQQNLGEEISHKITEYNGKKVMLTACKGSKLLEASHLFLESLLAPSPVSEMDGKLSSAKNIEIQEKSTIAEHSCSVSTKLRDEPYQSDTMYNVNKSLDIAGHTMQKTGIPTVNSNLLDQNKPQQQQHNYITQKVPEPQIFCEKLSGPTSTPETPPADEDWDNEIDETASDRQPFIFGVNQFKSMAIAVNNATGIGAEFRAWNRLSNTKTNKELKEERKQQQQTMLSRKVDAKPRPVLDEKTKHLALNKDIRLVYNNENQSSNYAESKCEDDCEAEDCPDIIVLCDESSGSEDFNNDETNVYTDNDRATAYPVHQIDKLPKEEALLEMEKSDSPEVNNNVFIGNSNWRMIQQDSPMLINMSKRVSRCDVDKWPKGEALNEEPFRFLERKAVSNSMAGDKYRTPSNSVHFRKSISYAGENIRPLFPERIVSDGTKALKPRKHHFSDSQLRTYSRETIMQFSKSEHSRRYPTELFLPPIDSDVVAEVVMREQLPFERLDNDVTNMPDVSCIVPVSRCSSKKSGSSGSSCISFADIKKMEAW